MLRKHKDTIVKTVLVAVGLILFKIISFWFNPNIIDSPLYSWLYVIINLLLVVMILQAYGMYEDYNRTVAITWQKYKLIQIESSLEHLKSTLFANLDLSDSEVEEYERKEREIQSVTKDYLKKL